MARDVELKAHSHKILDTVSMPNTQVSFSNQLDFEYELNMSDAQNLFRTFIIKLTAERNQFEGKT